MNWGKMGLREEGHPKKLSKINKGAERVLGAEGKTYFVFSSITVWLMIKNKKKKKKKKKERKEKKKKKIALV